jgi:hypothetical protein
VGYLLEGMHGLSGLLPAPLSVFTIRVGTECPSYGRGRGLAATENPERNGFCYRQSIARLVGWALVPTRIDQTGTGQATAPTSHAGNQARQGVQPRRPGSVSYNKKRPTAYPGMSLYITEYTQLLHSPPTLGIMRLPGRLVQLVRILGRHPRGRRFESCTAHQTLQISRSPRGSVEKRRSSAFSVLACQARFLLLHELAKNAQQADIPPFILLRQEPFHAILAGFGMGSSF